MRRIVIGLLAGLALVLGTTQLLLPPYLEGRVEDRLTAHGGSADVDLGAVPALRLLTHHGHRFRLTGHDLRLASTGHGIKRLDGFDEVDVELDSSRVGPIQADTIRLDRGSEGSPYHLRASGSTTARELSTYFAGSLGGLAAGALPLSDRPLPFSLDTTLRSRGGRLEASSTDLTVAGFPGGPFADLIVGAVAASL